MDAPRWLRWEARKMRTAAQALGLGPPDFAANLDEAASLIEYQAKQIGLLEDDLAECLGLRGNGTGELNDVD